MIQQVSAALKILTLAFRDTWQELWTILIVQLMFLFGNLLIIPGPPATLALFFYGNRIAHGEIATERDFLQAIRDYWRPAWHWGLINLVVLGLLIGDYYLTGQLGGGSNLAYFLQGLYLSLLVAWLLTQLFTLPFLFEQEEPIVSRALRNAAVFIGRNLVFVLMLALLLAISLIIGTLAFMLTFALGGAFVAIASNRAVIEHLAK